MSNGIRSVAAALMTCTLAACRDAISPGETVPPITGTYALSTVNGSALPAEISHTGVSYQVLAEHLTLTFNGTGVVTEHGTFQIHNGGVIVSTESESDSGSYAQSHDTVTMTMASGKYRTVVVDNTLLIGTDPIYWELYWRISP